MDADEDGQTGLSQPVRAAIDEAVRMIEELIAGVEQIKSGIAAERKKEQICPSQKS